MARNRLVRLVLSCLNDWGLVNMRVFVDLKRAGVICDTADPFCFRVGGTHIAAAGWMPGGLYSARWSEALESAKSTENRENP